MWRKSTRSEDLGNCCVEVGIGDGIVALRDSKAPDEVLWFEPDDWRTFVRLVQTL
jgi:hypothetical protein